VVHPLTFFSSFPGPPFLSTPSDLTGPSCERLCPPQYPPLRLIDPRVQENLSVRGLVRVFFFFSRGRSRTAAVNLSLSPPPFSGCGVSRFFFFIFYGPRDILPGNPEDLGPVHKHPFEILRKSGSIIFRDSVVFLGGFQLFNPP